MELFYLQLTILAFFFSRAFLLTVDNFSCFAYNCSFFAYNFSLFAYSSSFFAYSGKVRLIRALRDCKQRSSHCVPSLRIILWVCVCNGQAHCDKEKLSLRGHYPLTRKHYENSSLRAILLGSVPSKSPGRNHSWNSEFCRSKSEEDKRATTNVQHRFVQFFLLSFLLFCSPWAKTLCF